MDKGIFHDEIQGNAPSEASPPVRGDGGSHPDVSIVYYAITVTFKRLFSKSALGMFKETAPVLTRILHQSTSYELYPEWRHTTGDIHYHGKVVIKDYIKWFKSTLPYLKRLGFCLIKKIDNMEKWDNYLKKEQYIAKAISPLPLPITKQVLIVKSKKQMPKAKDLSVYEILKQYNEDEEVELYEEPMEI